MAIRKPVPYSASNFRHLYAEVFWFGILLGSTMSFFAIFAAHLGASSFQISLLTAGPAVMNMAFSLPAGRWLEDRQLIRTSFIASFWHRIGYLLVIPLPWLFGAKEQVWVAVLIILTMSIPGTMLAIAFNAAFASVVPGEWRATVVGRRNALLALTTALTSLLCGWLLDKIVFPLNYQLVFTLGAAGAMLSTYHLSRLVLAGEPALHIRNLLPTLARSLFSVAYGLRNFRSKMARRLTSQPGAVSFSGMLRSPFAPFMAVFFLFYSFQYTAIPVFPVYLVRELGITDGQISLGSALFYTTMLVASVSLGWVTSRLRHHGTLVVGGLLFGLYPLLIAQAQDARLFWAASLIGGVAWGFTFGGLTNRLMERVPEINRPAYMAFHNLIMNLGILSGSLAGPLLSEWMGMRNMLVANAGMRLLVGILFIFWG